MARRYELGLQSVAAATGAPYMLLATSTNRVRVREIVITLNAATSSTVTIGRPANTPVPTGGTAPQAVDPGDPASTTLIHTTWSTAPTAPAAFFRRWIGAATIGVGVPWVWQPDAPLIVSASSFLVLWNSGGATGSVLNVSWSLEE